MINIIRSKKYVKIMKSIILFLVLLVTPFVITSQSYAGSNQSLTYEDKLLGFKFEYPAQWNQTPGKNTKDTGVAIDLNNFTTAAPSGVSIYTEKLQEINERPQENESTRDNNERPQENERPPEIKTLKQYLNNFIYSENCCVDFRSIKFNESNLGGIPSMSASWNHVDESKNIIGKNWLNFAIKDGIAYVIYYHTPTEESFHKFLPQVKNIVSSFQVILQTKIKSI